MLTICDRANEVTARISVAAPMATTIGTSQVGLSCLSRAPCRSRTFRCRGHHDRTRQRDVGPSIMRTARPTGGDTRCRHARARASRQARLPSDFSLAMPFKLNDERTLRPMGRQEHVVGDRRDLLRLLPPRLGARRELAFPSPALGVFVCRHFQREAHRVTGTRRVPNARPPSVGSPFGRYATESSRLALLTPPRRSTASSQLRSRVPPNVIERRPADDAPASTRRRIVEDRASRHRDGDGETPVDRRLAMLAIRLAVGA